MWYSVHGYSPSPEPSAPLPQDRPPPHLAPLAVCPNSDADPLELARAILLGQAVALQVVGTSWLTTPEQLRQLGHTTLRLYCRGVVLELAML
ncbi:MAG: hypothetical protein HY335_01365 [Deinococcus sp.]|nr:hypothetical protein [Deinococcus sp.]